MVARFINDNFVPLSAHIKQNPAYFKRFGAVWTPTVLILDRDGRERWRLEGYLPKNDFLTNLKLGLARVALSRKDWKTAGRFYAEIGREGSVFAAQAVYYDGVARYSESHEHTILGETAKELHDRFPGTEWTLRSIPWLK